MNVKKIWAVFNTSSKNDKDIRMAFVRAATPDAWIELLEENVQLDQRVKELEQKVSELIMADYDRMCDSLSASISKNRGAK